MSAAIQPKTYILPEVTTDRNSCLQIVAKVVMAIGVALAFLSIWAALVVVVVGYYANSYLGSIDEDKALNTAIHDGSLCKLKWLLALGANPNMGRGGSRPIHWAAINGRADMLRCLIDAGADPHAVDYGNQNALNLAVQDLSVECVELLLEQNVDPDVRLRGVSPDWTARERIEHQLKSFEEGRYSAHGHDKRTREERLAAAQKISALLKA